jgi:hypothetical protein
MTHAVPKELYDYVLRGHNDGLTTISIYCPLGHAWGFSGKTQVEVERQEVERLKAVSQRRKDELDFERRSHAATKGHATRLKNRIAKGVCPCCNRSFPQMREHMRTEHPEFTVPE